MKENAIMPCLGYTDALKAIDWLCDVFQFEKHQVYLDETGLVAHAELKLGNAMIMLGSQQRDSPYTRLTIHPSETKGLETQSPYLVMDDVEAHYNRARKMGATIAIDLIEEHGGRNYSCYDLEGHLWNFGSYDPFASDHSHTGTEEALKKFEQGWNAAIEQNDADKIALFMAPDWVMVSGEGAISTREAFLEAVKSGALHHTQMEFEIKYVQVHGHCGTVTKLGTSAGSYQGQSFSYYEWATSTFVKKQGVWQSILTMLTPAQED